MMLLSLRAVQAVGSSGTPRISQYSPVLTKSDMYSGHPVGPWTRGTT
ncbi:MAG TPA: hypothetical protein VN414_09295 [Methanosarcina sp.]|nr:hypothetical protein [Methanosarcina sp.]